MLFIREDGRIFIIGNPPPNSTELPASKRMTSILDELKKRRYRDY